MTNIAILIPTYNSAATLGATLSSLRAQHTALAHVSAVYLADDCSQDGTIEAARRIWAAPGSLHILCGERNLGERANVNRALGTIRAKADWVLFLHADDVVKECWLRTMVLRIEACGDDVGSICSSWDSWRPSGVIAAGEDDPSRPVEVIRGGRASVRGTLLRGCWWHISGCAIRMRAFADVGEFFPQLPQQGDWEWLLRCLGRGWSVEYIPRTLLLYRQHEKSVSAYSFQRDDDIIESLRIVRQYASMLSWADLIVFHGRRVRFAIMRVGRALLQARIDRRLRGVTTVARVLVNLVRCHRPRPNRLVFL
jgi:glycosyltransferase involved in cell wall biosynthesis